MPTTNTPIRLTDEDRAKIAEIQEWCGLPSMAAAVRFAIQRAHHGFVVAPREANVWMARKSRKRKDG